MTDTLLHAAKILTGLTLLAAVASLHPRLRPAIKVAGGCFVGVALCMLGAAFL